MDGPPLTHHEILALVAPFARAGRHVDLAASDRVARRVAFRVRAHDASASLPALHEALVLEPGESAAFRLTRTLTAGDVLQATLIAEAATTADVLARIDAVPFARQIRRTGVASIARSYRIAASADASPILTHAHARLDGLDIAMRVSRVGGIPAELTLTPTSGAAMDLPEDFLAVLGWPRSRPSAAPAASTAGQRLGGEGAARTADAELQLDRTCAHVAASLAESPQRFHARHRLARWGVTLRRAVPLLACVAILGATFGVASLDLAENSIWRMLMFHAPPLLLLLYVVLPEMPRIEIPPLPRRPRSPTWRAPRAPSFARE